MTNYELIALVFLQAGVVLALVLVLATIGKVRRWPPRAAIIVAVASTVVGLALLWHSHLCWGGPLGQLKSIPERIAYSKSANPDAFDYWDLTYPMYYSGVFAYAFLLGAGAILWTRLGWSRWIIVSSTAVLIALCIIRAAVPLWSPSSSSILARLSGPNIPALGVAVVIGALMTVFLCLPRARTGRSRVQEGIEPAER